MEEEFVDVDVKIPNNKDTFESSIPFTDDNKCVLCGVKEGLPGKEVGQHLVILNNEHHWIHDECANWSPQTYMGEDGCWYNIATEIERSRQLKCFHCKKRGATIGCHQPKCKKSFHYPCALKTGWTFSPEEGFKCTKHRVHSSSHCTALINQKETEIKELRNMLAMKTMEIDDLQETYNNDVQFLKRKLDTMETFAKHIEGSKKQKTNHNNKCNVM